MLEVDVDVRKWSYMAKTMIARCFDSGSVPDAKLHIGLLLEGAAAAELPERLLGVLRLESLQLGNALEVAGTARPP